MTPALSAAFRLLCAASAEGKLHTHERRAIVHLQGSKNAAKFTYRGRTFYSLSDAARRLHVSRETVRKMLADGRARYK